jgi:hypothetical protein
MTRSAELIARLRQYVQIERSLLHEETPLQVAALELAEAYEALIHQALRMEAAIHRLTKDTPT